MMTDRIINSLRISLTSVIIQAHRSCMEEVMDVCRSSYPTLSSKITKYLQQVVHKGCTHEG